MPDAAQIVPVQEICLVGLLSYLSYLAAELLGLSGEM